MDSSAPVDPAFEQAWKEHPLSAPHPMPLIVQSYKDVAYHFWQRAHALSEEPEAEPPAAFELLERRPVSAPANEGREYVGVAAICDDKERGGELILIAPSQAVLGRVWESAGYGELNPDQCKRVKVQLDG